MNDEVFMDPVCIDDVLGFTLLWEGGFSDNKNDPGGKTMNGVTQKTYDSYRASIKQPARTVLLLTEQERDTIYKQMYWDPCMCSEMSYPLALVVFDCAVNCGVRQSIRFLQRALKCADDGIVGTETMRLVRAVSDQRSLAIELIQMREQFYHNLVKTKPTMNVFLSGWLNRTSALKKSI